MTLALAIILFVIFLGAVTQGTAGVGLGLVATPFVAALEPALVPGPMLLLMALAAIWTAWRDRAAVDRRWAVAALAGRLPGTILGAWAFALMSLHVYAWVFALSVVAGVAASLVAPRVPPRPRGLALAGLLLASWARLPRSAGRRSSWRSSTGRRRRCVPRCRCSSPRVRRCRSSRSPCSGGSGSTKSCWAWASRPQ